MSAKWLNPSERLDILLAARDLTPNEKFVLVAISHHMCRENNAWPSQPRLAALTSISLRTVKRMIANLCKRGIITTHRTSKHSTNHYQIAWDRLATSASTTPDSVTVTPSTPASTGHGDPPAATRGSVTVTPGSVTVTPGSVTVTPGQCHGDTGVVSPWPPEGVSEGGSKGPPKGKQKEVCRPARLEHGGELKPEVTEGRDLPEEAADCDTFTRDLDSGSDEGGDSDPEETGDAPPAVVGFLPRPTLADRIAELDELDDADTDDQPDILAELGLAPAQPDEQDGQTLPPIPAVDPEVADAEAYWQQKTEQELMTLALAKHEAAELDQSLQKARNTRLPAEKRVMHAANLVRGVERLAGLVGHRFRVWLERSEVRFSNWSGECLAALELLHPEVGVWDLFLALESVSEMNANCWRVAVKEEVWRSVAHWAEVEAGRRLAGELCIVSHGESTYMEAVRKFRAGLIDHYGERTRGPVAV